MREGNHAAFETAALEAWLRLDAWRLPSPSSFVAELCRQLNSAGMPVARVNCHIRYLDPEIVGVSYVLQNRDGDVKEVHIAPEMREKQIFLNSPMAPILLGQETAVRADLEASPAPGEWPLLADLRAEGLTEYVNFAVPFSDGTICSLSLAADRPGGFAKSEIAIVESLLPATGRILELHSLRRLSTMLLDAYVGHRSGARILSGRIRLGDVETIDAVLWFSDLRGSTALAARLEPTAYIELLNAYFAATAGEVLAAGGEVLKLIGDGVMAAFPVDGAQPASVAATALQAAREAVGKVATLSSDDGEPLACGEGLHRGAVMYGNVGVPQRLDFTLTGAAANLVTRVESLCRDLGRPILASPELAKLLPGTFAAVGRHDLRGIGEPLEIFAPTG